MQETDQEGDRGEDGKVWISSSEDGGLSPYQTGPEDHPDNPAAQDHLGRVSLPSLLTIRSGRLEY
jgi:hypothetical protein